MANILSSPIQVNTSHPNGCSNGVKLLSITGMLRNIPVSEIHGVFIVEDDERTRINLAHCVQSCPELRLLGVAASVAQAVNWCATTPENPRVLLTDLGLPDGSGISVIECVLHRFPECEALVLSMFGDEDHVIASISAGALGYIQKDASPDDIAETILDLIGGASPISPGIARRLLTKFQQPIPTLDAAKVVTSIAISGTVKLTPREADVLDLLARGFSYGEIGKAHGLTTNTVASHVKSLYRKLNVRSRGEAVFEALQSGIISAGRTGHL